MEKHAKLSLCRPGTTSINIPSFYLLFFLTEVV